MKKKIANFVKNNFKGIAVGVIIGGVIFGSIGVSAITYFPSNDVTCDNSVSGLESNNVQGAIDELYNTCSNSSIVDDGVLKGVEIVDCGDGLYKDNYVENRYVYKGTDPNNYVTFNNQEAGWRIIAVEPDGTIKIMGKGKSSKWASSGTNDWLNSSAISELNDKVSYSPIVSHDFGIGKVTLNESLAETINKENSVIWNGKVGLPTVSDYLRANSRESICGTGATHRGYCGYSNWMYVTNRVSNFWFMTASASSSGSVYGVISDSGKGGTIAAYSTGINGISFFLNPVVYVSSSVQITGGDGSQSNPYTLS